MFINALPVPVYVRVRESPFFEAQRVYFFATI